MGPTTLRKAPGFFKFGRPPREGAQIYGPNTTTGEVIPSDFVEYTIYKPPTRTPTPSITSPIIPSRPTAPRHTKNKKSYRRNIPQHSDLSVSQLSELDAVKAELRAYYHLGDKGFRFLAEKVSSLSIASLCDPSRLSSNTNTPMYAVLSSENLQHHIKKPSVHSSLALSVAGQNHTSQISLPSELWDVVVDILFDERETIARSFKSVLSHHRNLRTCALTCKAWQPRSYYHQFRSIHLGHFNYRSFLRICRLSPHIKSQVTHLNIWGGIDGSAMLYNIAVMLPLQQMPQLSSLTLQSFSSMPAAPRFHQAMSRFRAVETMVVCNASPVFIEQLSYLASSLGHLSKIIVTSRSPPKSLFTESFASIDDRPSSWSLKDLQRTKPLQIHFDGSHVYGTARTNLLLESCGPLLLDVTLDVCQPSQDGSSLDLSHNTLLANLVLTSIYDKIACHDVGTILSSISSKHLQYLRLEIWPGGSAKWCFERDDWDRVSAALDEENFQRLKKIDIIFYVNSAERILPNHGGSFLHSSRLREIVAYEERCIPDPAFAERKDGTWENLSDTAKSRFGLNVASK